MARTLYLNDGSTEVVIGDQEEVLGRIIEERLGRDCKELFDDIKYEWIEEPWDTNDKEDYERIADGYYQMLQNVLENLNTALTFFKQSRLNRKELQKNLRSKVRLTLSFLLTVIWIINIGAETVMTSALSVWHN